MNENKESENIKIKREREYPKNTKVRAQNSNCFLGDEMEKRYSGL